MAVSPAVEWTRTSPDCRTSGMRSVNPSATRRRRPNRATRRPASASSWPHRTSATAPGTASASAEAPSRSPTAQPPPEITTTGPSSGRPSAARDAARDGGAAKRGSPRPRTAPTRAPGPAMARTSGIASAWLTRCRSAPGCAQKRSAATSVTTATTGTGRRPSARRRPRTSVVPGYVDTTTWGRREATARRRPRPQATSPIAPNSRRVSARSWTRRWVRSNTASPAGVPKLDPSRSTRRAGAPIAARPSTTSTAPPGARCASSSASTCAGTSCPAPIEALSTTQRSPGAPRGPPARGLGCSAVAVSVVLMGGPYPGRRRGAAARSARGQVGRQRHVGRRARLAAVVPAVPGQPVAALVRAVAADREEREPAGAAVREPPAHVRAHAGGVAALQAALLAAVELERQRAVQDEVDLLLAAVRVDPPALARLQEQQVEPEGGEAEGTAQRHETLAGVEVEVREGG